MGWANSHQHGFTIDWTDSSFPDPGYEDDLEDERCVRLDKVCPRPSTHFSYVYHFGDSRERDVVVEEIIAPERGQKYPMCIAGARACPPEDCDVTWGYEEMLAAMRDPKHEEHAELREWLGERVW
jgi:hypothetical protein